MKIINPQVTRDIEQGVPLKLNLGGGQSQHKDYYTIDIVEMEEVDIVADLNNPLNLIPDNSVVRIYSRHAFEHITNFMELMSEIYRITKKGGEIEIAVPHFSNPFGYSDPTHVRFFGLYSMYYFVNPENQPFKRKIPAYYSQTRFKVNDVKIQFYRLNFFDRIYTPILSGIINKNIKWQNFYERRLCRLFHAWQIKYKMQVDK